MKRALIIRMWGFTFPFIDTRLMGLVGLFFGLMVAKLWSPILGLDWYWYLLIAVAFSIKFVITFFKQV